MACGCRFVWLAVVKKPALRLLAPTYITRESLCPGLEAPSVTDSRRRVDAAASLQRAAPTHGRSRCLESAVIQSIDGRDADRPPPFVGARAALLLRGATWRNANAYIRRHVHCRSVDCHRHRIIWSGI